MAERDLYLFCYDVSCRRRWRQVYRVLRHWRVAGQKSVFECLMTPAELRLALAQIKLHILPAEDRVHVILLDPRMPREGWGRATMHDGGPLVVV